MRESSQGAPNATLQRGLQCVGHGRTKARIAGQILAEHLADRQQGPRQGGRPALAACYPYQPAYLPVARLRDGTLWNW